MVHGPPIRERLRRCTATRRSSRWGGNRGVVATIEVPRDGARASNAPGAAVAPEAPGATRQAQGRRAYPPPAWEVRRRRKGLTFSLHGAPRGVAPWPRGLAALGGDGSCRCRSPDVGSAPRLPARGIGGVAASAALAIVLAVVYGWASCRGPGDLHPRGAGALPGARALPLGLAIWWLGSATSATPTQDGR